MLANCRYKSEVDNKENPSVVLNEHLPTDCTIHPDYFDNVSLQHYVDTEEYSLNPEESFRERVKPALEDKLLDKTETPVQVIIPVSAKVQVDKVQSNSNLEVEKTTQPNSSTSSASSSSSSSLSTAHLVVASSPIFSAVKAQSVPIAQDLSIKKIEVNEESDLTFFHRPQKVTKQAWSKYPTELNVHPR